MSVGHFICFFFFHSHSSTIISCQVNLVFSVLPCAATRDDVRGCPHSHETLENEGNMRMVEEAALRT